MKSERQREAETAMLEHLHRTEVHNLSRLMASRRVLYAVPDQFFLLEPLANRVFLRQLEEDEGETYGDTNIIRPASVREREKYQSSRGLIVSAGLDALKTLHDNGVGVGHIVRIVQDYIHSVRLAAIGGADYRCIITSPDFIVGSEDLAREISAGRVSRQYFDDEGEWRYVDSTGGVWDPDELECPYNATAESVAAELL